MLHRASQQRRWTLANFSVSSTNNYLMILGLPPAYSLLTTLVNPQSEGVAKAPLGMFVQSQYRVDCELYSTP